MTGFARRTGHGVPDGWSWEVKSVNARGLDIRCRLPAGMDTPEPEGQIGRAPGRERV